MSSAINLYVFAVFADGDIVRVGRILSRNIDSFGAKEGFFKYAPEYLRHPKAYALDPVHLPLAEKTFIAASPELGIHSIFDDSLPDAWGRHILARKGALHKTRFAPAHLLKALASGGLGGLLYSAQENGAVIQDMSIAFSDISAALSEAGKLEESIDTESAELRHLLACGSSAGGARPKVLTLKDQHSWIAKFASRKDPHPSLFVALEHAGLTLAAMAGLQVPKIQRIDVHDRTLLLIKRFDITASCGRNAIASFRTLLGIEDQYSVSYSDMAEIIRLHSHQPGVDLERLYRQMVVNVLLVNTDDHLQNFAMLHTKEGWQLSPTYDIVPNIYQTEQILQINGKHSPISKEDVIAEGRKFGLSLPKCKVILSSVVDKIKDWPLVFESMQVPEAHTKKLRTEISHRFHIFDP